MIKKIKSSQNIKLFASMLTFSLAGLFFINSAPPPSGGVCYSCGSWSSCSDGDPMLEQGWSECDPSPGWPACEVSGTYGPCGGNGNT